MNKLIPLLALCCLLPSYASAQAVTREVINPANGHTYGVLEPSSWTLADSQATFLGGYLVSVTDAAENTWVWNEFQWETTGNIWIGLTDRNVEGTFEWTSGEPFVYQYWHWSEPNDLNGVEDYGCMWGWYGGNWNDFDDMPYGWGDWYGVVEWSDLHLVKPVPVTSGAMGTLQVTGASPGSTIMFGVSSQLAPGPWNAPGYPGMPIYLKNPVRDIGSSVANAMGVAELSKLVPPGMSGVTVYAQGFDLVGLNSTKSAAVVIN
jgi:hypothetical protein